MSKTFCLVARCRSCGSISAAAVILESKGQDKELGRIVQKSLRGFDVAIDKGPVSISGCNCTAEQRALAKEIYQ